MNQQELLLPDQFLDFTHPNFDAFLANIDRSASKKDQALSLYLLVRDAFLYDPYHLDLRQESLQSSTLLTKKRAWCVEKSIVMAASARALGIPSKLGFAIVKNHLDVEKLIRYLRKDEIVFHGYVSLFLNDKWVRCTPAFDRRVCRVAGVEPLSFDGENDSLFQAYNGGKKFMEYIHSYGEFDGLPLELMRSEMKKHYPHLFEEPILTRDFSFQF